MPNQIQEENKLPVIDYRKSAKPETNTRFQFNYRRKFKAVVMFTNPFKTTYNRIDVPYYWNIAEVAMISKAGKPSTDAKS